MFRVTIRLIKWFGGLLWTLVRKKSVDWGSKLKELMSILTRVIQLVFKKDDIHGPIPRRRRRFRDFFKRIRRRG